MGKRLSKLLKRVKEYNPAANFKLIKKAYQFAEIAHAGQLRLSGDPVMEHLISVAEILAELKLDSTSIAAGLLHDVIEDGGVTLEELKKEFGEEVSLLVNGVTKVGNLKLRENKEEEFVENLRKMILVMAKDLRVVFIKLADRLHNLRTLQYLPPEKQIRIAKETLEVYAPLADRLGIGEMKGKLEDFAFPYVYPKEYQTLLKYSKPYYRKAEEFLKKATRVVYKALAKEGIRAKISSRPKHIYSLWQKLKRSEINGDIGKIYDLVAMRILVETVQDCYAALGIVHSLWKPVPNLGVRDYVAQPKPNGYRSIHTNVFSLHERILEIQIRTFQMHEEAENGVAGHWYYASAKSKGVSAEKLERGDLFVPGEKLSWVKQLVGWQKEIVESKEFMEALKFDALAHRIFVFSPKGDVYDLPAGATPVDFAYAVHTELGNAIDGAKVNGKLVPLSSKLKSGDIVEVINKKNSQPSKKWLEFVVTRTAKKEIEKYLRKKV